NSSQSMVESGAYSEYTASEISNMFSVPESDVQTIFSEMNVEDKVMLYDLITYIYENKTISTTANALQTKINTEYNDNAYLFEDMTAQQIADKLGYSVDIVSLIYEDMGCTSAKPYEVINYIVENNTIEDICDNYQQLIDVNYTKTAPLRSNSELVSAAQAFVLLYENTTAEEFKSAFTESYNNASIALTTNSYSEVQSQYKFITTTVLDNIYASYGLNKDSDEIANYQLLKALSDNNVAFLYGEGLQSYIDSLNTEDYQNSDEGKTELTYNQVLMTYAFVSSDTLDSIYSSYGLNKDTDSITSYQLIKVLSENNIAKTYFSNVQTYINNQNENSEILFDDDTRSDAETLISRYSNTAIDFKAAYETQYLEYKAAITEYTYQQVLNTYQFLTIDDVTQIYEDLNLDINTDTIAVYQLLAPLSEDNMAQDFGKSQQRSILFKQAFMSVLFTEMSKADIEDQYAIPSIYLDTMFSDLEAENTLEVHDILKYIVDNNLITEIGNDKEDMVTDAMNKIESGKAMFSQNGYTMLVYNLNMEFSSQEAFDAVAEMKTKMNTIYDENYIISASSTYSDIQTVYNQDIVKVSLISVIAILVICSITFSSVFTAALITLLIQGSIWISMGINTLTGYEPFFICYLVVMCIQMGATVDYGILISTKYIAYRKTMDKHLAITKSLNNAFPTVLTSGSILVIAAGIVGIASSASVISEIGWQLARGCLISIIMVLLVLPQTLLLFDKWIEKTTLKTTFYHGVGRRPKLANATNSVINDMIEVEAEDVETIVTNPTNTSVKR
ncbi:MAG: MMPL family transporter, partial [Methanomethylophilus sp.]